MKGHFTHNYLALAALLCALSAPQAQCQMFPGSVDANMMTCNGFQFLADTGNDTQVFISQTVAACLGFGTINANGTFTPAAAFAGAPMMMLNNGAYNVWQFTPANVYANDTNGLSCGAIGIHVYVAKNQGRNAGEPAGNAVIATRNILTKGWLALLGACLGPNNTGYWNPGWTPPAARAMATPNVDPATGVTQQTVSVGLQNGANSVSLPMVVSTSNPYTFIPQSEAATLGLTVNGSINLGSTSAGVALLNEMVLGNQLAYNGSNGTGGLGQTTFQEAALPSLNTGIGPTQSGEVLLLNDTYSGFGILGDNFLNGYQYAPGFNANGNDELFYPGATPEPGALALLASAGLGAISLRARKRPRK